MSLLKKGLDLNAGISGLGCAEPTTRICYFHNMAPATETSLDYLKSLREQLDQKIGQLESVNQAATGKQAAAPAIRSYWHATCTFDLVD